jgi:8-oxo-dGTP pyrophosphatase MutT (NUDIX family)
MTPFTLVQIRAALARHRPAEVERAPGDAAASVALVLAGPEDDLALCAIRRAEHPSDPWSGHMALPGGRADPADSGPRAAAERETLEEVGLALAAPHRLGALSQVPVRLGGGGGRQMVLSSFVYYLGTGHPPFVLSDEVAEAFWIPLSYLWDPRNAGRFTWKRDGANLLYPAIRFGDAAIWGLTFRVLTLFSDVLDAPLPHLEEIPGLSA